MSELQFDPPPSPKPKSFPWVSVWLVLLTGLCIGLYFKTEKPLVSNNSSSSSLTWNEEDQTLHLQLRKALAFKEAANLLEERLKQIQLEPKRMSKLYLELGSDYENAELLDKALRAYHRSALYAKDPKSEASRNASRHIIVVLEKLGRATALRDHLSKRNSENQGHAHTSKDPVVARMKHRDITMSELDDNINSIIQMQLNYLKSQNQSQELQTQERNLRNQFSTPERKLALLEEWTQKELLLQEARRRKIAEQKNFKTAQRQIFDDLLLQEIQRQEQQKIQLLDHEVEQYIQNHRSELGLGTDPGHTDPEKMAKAFSMAQQALFKEKAQQQISQLLHSLKQENPVEINRDLFKGAQP